ncbi:protein kinase [Cystoisospora suis]|uniref:non-specific serine/threonine protein kinase n=1 Tax=Cystoisospora suis TaxID=483139 RepID=A0A2C6KT66_9APIC|nr:protein kinase [Cystoisospora suis]
MLPMNRRQVAEWSLSPLHSNRSEPPVRPLDFRAGGSYPSLPADVLLPGIASPRGHPAPLSSAVRRRLFGMPGGVTAVVEQPESRVCRSQCAPALPRTAQLKLAKVVRSCCFPPRHLRSSCDGDAKVDGESVQIGSDPRAAMCRGSRTTEQGLIYSDRLSGSADDSGTTQCSQASGSSLSSAGSPQHRQNLWLCYPNAESEGPQAEILPALHSHSYVPWIVRRVSVNATAVEGPMNGASTTSLWTEGDEGSSSTLCGRGCGRTAAMLPLEASVFLRGQSPSACARLLGETPRAHGFTGSGVVLHGCSTSRAGGRESDCHSTVEATDTEDMPLRGLGHQHFPTQETQHRTPAPCRALPSNGGFVAAAKRCSLLVDSEAWAWGATAAPSYVDSLHQAGESTSERLGRSYGRPATAVSHEVLPLGDPELLAIWGRSARVSDIRPEGKGCTDRRLRALGNTVDKMRHHRTSLRPEDVVFESTLSTETGGLQYCVTEEGSFGKVFVGHLASDPKEKVAIKIPAEPMLKRDAGGVIERIMNEWKLLSVCKHPNIVDLIGGVIHGPFDVWLITRLVRGGYDLHSRKYSHNPAVRRRIPPSAALFMCRQLAAVVAFLHEEAPHKDKPSVVHRDIKPENIIVDEDWFIRLCDFGDAEASIDGCLSRVSGATWSYAPPELLLSCPVNCDVGDSRSEREIGRVHTPGSGFRGESSDPDVDIPLDAGLVSGPKWDVWSMGCVFHEMFGFPNPFHVYLDVDDAPETIHKKLRLKAQEGSLIPVIAPQLQGLARNIIASCLNPDPRKRPSAIEVYNLWSSGDHLVLKDVHPDLCLDRGS